MPDKFKIATGFLTLALAYDLRVALGQRTRIATLQDTLITVHGAYKASDAENDYLRKKLDEHEIVPDEFDLIVLNSNLLT